MEIGDIVVPDRVSEWRMAKAWENMVAICVDVENARFRIICGKPDAWEHNEFTVFSRQVDSHLKVVGHAKVSP